MKKNILFLLFAIFFIPKTNFGCSCLTPSSFCESIIDSNGDLFPDLIFGGEIISSSSEGKKIKVNQSIFGNINESEITIQPSFCTIFFAGLEDGKEYVIALARDNEHLIPLHCAIFFLEIENEIVKGKIAPDLESIAYGELGNLEGCGNDFKLFSLERNIIVFPNPTIDEIKIKNNSSTNNSEQLEIKIFDTIGRDLQVTTKVDGILPEEIWIVNIQFLPAGLYLIQLSDEYDEKIYRIVKQ